MAELEPVHIVVGTQTALEYEDAQIAATSKGSFILHTPASLGIIEPTAEVSRTSYRVAAHARRALLAQELVTRGLRNYFVMVYHGGIEIDALGGEPGINARYMHGGQMPMTIQEAADFCLKQLVDVPGVNRGVTLAGVVAVGHSEGMGGYDVSCSARGMVAQLVSKPEEIDRHEPLLPLFYLKDLHRPLVDIITQPRSYWPNGFQTHQEIGFNKAFAEISFLEARARELC